MPGELLSSNTVSVEDGMLVWKVDAYRVLADNYRLQAESRVMNIWAFVLTGLLLVVALILFIPTR
jgi:putative transmembrane protein